ncbi:amidohydrolase family protein [Dactylosporangium sp. CS-033363]|uniref:amidohydrolase family protein n=1 Tax=Dactylosporangium sp. CS-033363 TaxID=3239935 RepID=UPI003D913CED
MTTPTLARDVAWDGPVIDADVHANVPSLAALYPYLSRMWIDFTKERGYRGTGVVAAHYPPNSLRACHPRYRPQGRPPASDVTLLQEHVLDPWGVDHAIVNCYYGLDGLRHPDWAAALVSALNDWIIAEWLERDPRLRASLVVPARDPEAMIREIRRVGDHPGFVQVLLPVRNDAPWGQRVYHPVLREIAEHDLVAGLHYGGTTDGHPSSTGPASWFVEEYAAEWQSFAGQLTSLVSQGVFQAVPDLRCAVLEGGFLWLPLWGWRMNKEWKGLRREVPWLNDAPLDVIRRHFRFSTAPFDGGPVEMVAQCLEWLGSDDVLMHATDYPHGYDERAADLFAALPETMKPRTMAENARGWYRL